MKLVKVSIIIVSYNTKKLTIETIKSIFKETFNITFEVIVIDNDSNDGTVDELKKCFSNIQIIKNKNNAGFGVANNIASKYANGEYLFFLNSDTILLNNAIKILSNYMDINPRIAVVGGNLFFDNLKPASSFNRVFPGLLSEIDTFFFNIPTKIIYKRNVIHNFSNKNIKFKGNISGADLMIRKKIFEDVGKFDKDFFMYYEETELMYRVSRQGYYMASIPEAKIIHLEGASEDKKEVSHFRSFTSKWIYLKKTNKEKFIPLIHILFQLTTLQRILIFSILQSKNKVNYWKTLKRVEKETYEKVKNELRFHLFK